MISVIMPSYLGDYEGAASDRTIKIQRAINSFLAQDKLMEKELVIVSDGCPATDIIAKYFSKRTEMVRLIRIGKQPLFSGKVREAGIKHAYGDIIAYLDTDDEFGHGHLTAIQKAFKHHIIDVAFWNDTVRDRGQMFHERPMKNELGGIGVSNIAHIKDVGDWSGCDGYGHDFKFIKTLNGLNWFKIKGNYIVNHIKGSVDL